MKKSILIPVFRQAQSLISAVVKKRKQPPKLSGQEQPSLMGCQDLRECVLCQGWSEKGVEDYESKHSVKENHA